MVLMAQVRVMVLVVVFLVLMVVMIMLVEQDTVGLVLLVVCIVLVWEVRGMALQHNQQILVLQVVISLVIYIHLVGGAEQLRLRHLAQ